MRKFLNYLLFFTILFFNITTLFLFNLTGYLSIVLLFGIGTFAQILSLSKL